MGEVVPIQRKCPDCGKVHEDACPKCGRPLMAGYGFYGGGGLGPYEICDGVNCDYFHKIPELEEEENR